MPENKHHWSSFWRQLWLKKKEKWNKGTNWHPTFFSAKTVLIWPAVLFWLYDSADINFINQTKNLNIITIGSLL